MSLRIYEMGTLDDERADLDGVEAMIEGAYDLRHVPVYAIRAMIRELRERRTVQGEPASFECPNCLIDVTPPTTNRENGSER